MTMKKRKILPTLLGVITGAIGGAVAIGTIMSKNMNKWRELADKNCALFLLMNKWIKTKQEGKDIEEYLKKNGYKSVAIYGLSHVGKCLLEELKDCDVEIKYAVDRNATTIYSNIEVYSPESDLPKVDVMIVTAVYFFGEIYNNLKDKVEYPIVSLENILYELDKY